MRFAADRKSWLRHFPHSPSSWPHAKPVSRDAVAFNDMASQQAPLLVAEIGAGMQRTAIVPENEIPHAPFVRIDELILLDMVEKRIEQFGALRRIHALDRP